MGQPIAAATLRRSLVSSCTFSASSAPQSCSPREVSISYNNTILYTDYVLEKTITLLEQNSEKYQSFMMYISDHRESLGENSAYLHGLPKSIAPESQTHVPLVLWLSGDMYNAFGMSVVHSDDCADSSCPTTIVRIPCYQRLTWQHRLKNLIKA